MTTEQAIIRFKNGCALPQNAIRRFCAVAYQFQRNTWEVPEPLGLVRIMYDGHNKATIQAWDKVIYSPNTQQPFVSGISVETYLELERLYKGAYNEDLNYQQRLNHLR